MTTAFGATSVSASSGRHEGQNGCKISESGRGGRRERTQDDKSKERKELFKRGTKLSSSKKCDILVKANVRIETASGSSSMPQL